MNLIFATVVNPYSDNAFGGAERSIRLMAEKFAHRGHNVTYFTVRSDAPACKLAAQRGVTLVAQRRMTRRTRMGRWLSDYLRFRQVKHLVRQTNADLVYAFYEPLFIRSFLTIPRSERPEIIMRMAGLAWYDAILKNSRLRESYIHFFSEIDTVNYIVAGLEEMTIEKLGELDFPVSFRDSFSGDIGSAATVGREEPYTKIPSDPFNIVMASRFSGYQKRQDLLIRAVALLPPESPARLLLIGSGQRYGKMTELVRELGLEDRVTIRPFMPQEELWALISQCNLLCLATEFEGLSKIVLEGMAKGVPMLVSDVPPLRSYVYEGQNGFLSPNTPEDWARRLQEVMADPQARQRVSNGAMEYIRREHDPDRNVVELEKAFAARLNR